MFLFINIKKSIFKNLYINNIIYLKNYINKHK